jgi:hypothetical protein
MPENQSQPNISGDTAAAGEPKLVPQPDGPAPDRPSDTEAAHAPEEGPAVRDPRLTDEQKNASADQNRGSLAGRRKDPTGDGLAGDGVGETGHPSPP